MKRVLVADDHEVTRRGIREIALEAFSDAEVHDAPNAATLHASIDGERWDLILLDVMMPGANILETLGRIRALDMAVPILVLTAATEIEYVVQTMKAGANGLIHKHHASDELLRAIRTVADGGKYLHPESAVEIARLLSEPEASLPHKLLSERELDIFLRLAKGCAVKEIAFDLGLSDKTVATYLARIRSKTSLVSHVDIARYALKAGLVS